MSPGAEDDEPRYVPKRRRGVDPGFFPPGVDHLAPLGEPPAPPEAREPVQARLFGGEKTGKVPMKKN